MSCTYMSEVRAFERRLDQAKGQISGAEARLLLLLIEHLFKLLARNLEWR